MAGVRAAVWLLAACLLAGCGNPAVPGLDGSATGSSSHAPQTSGTASPLPANGPPVATLAASVPGGALPLRVNFTLAGSDPDQDPLNWTLAFGDGSANLTGRDLPATVLHDYTAAGLHRVVLNVTDGALWVVRDLVVNATPGAPPAEIFSGKVVAPDGVENSEGECLFALMASAGAAPGGVAGDAFKLTRAKPGWVYAFDVAGMVAQFQSASGYAGSKAASGSVPDKATSVLACSHSAVNTAYRLTLTPP